jgi:hypothetical protein
MRRIVGLESPKARAISPIPTPSALISAIISFRRTRLSPLSQRRRIRYFTRGRAEATVMASVTGLSVILIGIFGNRGQSRAGRGNYFLNRAATSGKLSQKFLLSLYALPPVSALRLPAALRLPNRCAEKTKPRPRVLRGLGGGRGPKVLALLARDRHCNIAPEPMAGICPGTVSTISTSLQGQANSDRRVLYS